MVKRHTTVASYNLTDRIYSRIARGGERGGGGKTRMRTAACERIKVKGDKRARMHSENGRILSIYRYSIPIDGRGGVRGQKCIRKTEG